MQHWTPNPAQPGLALPSGSVSRLVDTIGNHSSSALATAILDVVGQYLAVDHCTVLTFDAERNPRVLSGASRINQWQLFNMAAVYTRKLFRQDDIQAEIRRRGQSQEISAVIVHRQQLADIDDDEFRTCCFEPLDICDRLAITTRVNRSHWITINLDQSAARGPFSTEAVNLVLQMANLLASCAVCHYAADVDGESAYRDVVTEDIGDLCPQLTTREREVLLRILDGVTTERIAEDLLIRPTTVITYRTRAYEKLGVSSRRELFATVLRQRSANNRRWETQPAHAA